MKKRELEDLLYEQVARIGKAVSSPKRLELMKLLAQGEKIVDVLASELSIDIKLAGAHLKALHDARLVSVALRACQRRATSLPTAGGRFACCRMRRSSCCRARATASQKCATAWPNGRPPECR